MESTEALANSVESLIVEKRLAKKERELIQHLQKLLNQIGYEVVRVSRTTRRKPEPAEVTASIATVVETQSTAE